MRTTARLLALAVALGSPACFLAGGSEEELNCDPAPVLAAAAGPTLALSCAATLRYEGTVYTLGCAPVHPSRLGPVFEHGGGETRYRGARRIRGIPTERMFALLDDGCGKNRTHVASNDAPKADYRTARSPLRRDSR